MEITQEYVRQVFNYKDGDLFWNIKPNTRVRIGDKAGSQDAKGYLYLSLDRKKYPVHHIVFLYFNGYLPKMIDHIDNIKNNNKIENLREATYSQNNRNVLLRKDNKSGIKNVFFEKWTKKWKVMLRIDGKRKCFGRYSDVDLAELVAIEARNKYHGEYANHGNKNEVSR